MPTLLIADEYENVLASLEFAFGQQGVRVVSAKSGSTALQLFENEKIDAALLALHMHSMDGTVACRLLRQRAHERGQNLPVWIMTAAPTSVAEKCARDAGAMGLLKKPFDCFAFLTDLNACLAGTIPVPPISPEASPRKAGEASPR